MLISTNMCSLLHSFVLGYFKSILLVAPCVAAFLFIFKMQRIHNFKSVDPEYTDEYVFIRLNRSKTDSFRQGIIIPLYKTGYVICPVLAVSIYVQLRQSLKSLDSEAFVLYI